MFELFGDKPGVDEFVKVQLQRLHQTRIERVPPISNGPIFDSIVCISPLILAQFHDSSTKSFEMMVKLKVVPGIIVKVIACFLSFSGIFLVFGVHHDAHGHDDLLPPNATHVFVGGILHHTQGFQQLEDFARVMESERVLNRLNGIFGTFGMGKALDGFRSNRLGGDMITDGFVSQRMSACETDFRCEFEGSMDAGGMGTFGSSISHIA